MERQSFSGIINDPHFNQYAALLSMAMSPKWRMNHSEIPNVRATLEYRLSRLVRGYLEDATSIRDDIVKEFSTLIQSIVEADSKLFYRVADYEWFVEVMDSDAATARFVLTALFAVSVSRRNFFSIEDVAEMAGDSAQKWRKRAADGQIIGAFQTGKTWVIPELSLRAIGVNVPGTAIEVETEE